MNQRRKRNLVLQKLFWNNAGFTLLRGYKALCRRINYVLLNHSLDSETNGEYWLLDNLPEEPVVVDVGFNTGDFTAEVLKRRPKAKIYAFDPARKIQAVYNARFGNDPRVNFFNFALSNEGGEFEFHDYDNMCSSLARRVDAGPEVATYKVAVLKFDDWIQQQGIATIDFLKIDAEGYDWNVIAGAMESIKSGKVAGTMFEFASGWVGNRKYLQDVFRLVDGLDLKICHVFNGFLLLKQYSLNLENCTHGSMYFIRRNCGWASSLPIKSAEQLP
jgi:FkbM family methyltransferase